MRVNPKIAAASRTGGVQVKRTMRGEPTAEDAVTLGKIAQLVLFSIVMGWFTTYLSEFWKEGCASEAGCFGHIIKKFAWWDHDDHIHEPPQWAKDQGVGSGASGPAPQF